MVLISVNKSLLTMSQLAHLQLKNSNYAYYSVKRAIDTVADPEFVEATCY